MQPFLSLLMRAVAATLIIDVSPLAVAEEPMIRGMVIDLNGQPVANATVAAMWRANGKPTNPDGTLLDLSDEKQLAQFWGNLGDMQAFSKQGNVTATDGTFQVPVNARSRALVAMDATRQRGGVAAIPVPYEQQAVAIRLVPLVTVYGSMKSLVAAKQIDWSHVYVELPEDASRPLAVNRIISCGSFDGRFEFRVPPGDYNLDAYAISDPVSEDIDLRVQPNTSFSIDGTQQPVDLGVLELTLAPPDHSQLEALARENGQWSDYTEHFGEAAPNWHAVAARGIHKDATIVDFRGKWLLIDFWGLSCAPCLSTGIPRLMDFYRQHADQKDQFEIVSVCIDHSGKLKDMQDLEAAMAPLVKHVWHGQEIEFPIVLDNTFYTWERYGIPGLGTVVLVDPQGNLTKGDETMLEHLLEKNPE